MIREGDDGGTHPQDHGGVDLTVGVGGAVPHPFLLQVVRVSWPASPSPPPWCQCTPPHRWPPGPANCYQEIAFNSIWSSFNIFPFKNSRVFETVFEMLVFGQLQVQNHY